MKGKNKQQQRRIGLIVLMMALFFFTSCQKSREEVSEMNKETETWRQIKEASKQEAPPFIPKLPQKFPFDADWYRDLNIKSMVEVADWAFTNEPLNARYSKGLYFILSYDKKAGRYFFVLHENTANTSSENLKWEKICSGTLKLTITCALNWLDEHKKCQVRIINDPIDGATAYGCCDAC